MKLGRASARLTQLAAILAALQLGLFSSVAAAQSDDVAFTKVKSVDQGGNSITVNDYSVAQERKVDISGMSVDFECAKRWNYDASETLRSALLRTGCAELTTQSPAADEAAAQDYAKSNKQGKWANNSSPPAGTTAGDSGKDWWDTATAWLSGNWLALASFVAAVLSIPFVVRVADKRKARRFTRDVYTVLAGAPAAGKTDLWEAWAKNRASRPGSQPTVRTQRAGSLQAERLGEFTLHPRLMDLSGSQPWELLREMRSAPSQSKRVLIIVVAPTTGDSTVGTAALDRDYIAKQSGYISLPLSLLGNGDNQLQPDVVALFVSKFDLLSHSPPWDSGSANMRDQIERAFGPTRAQLMDRCEQLGIPFVWIIGSSRMYWGVRDLRDEVIQHVVGGQKVK